MRLMWLVAICLLALMTTTAYRPLLDCTIATADPAMVLLAWLALIDRMPRILKKETRSSKFLGNVEYFRQKRNNLTII